METSLFVSDARTVENNRQPEPIILPIDSVCAVPEADQLLGQLMTETRERLPIYHIEMMESGDYAAIPDQLYLLPFFSRYATFLGLAVEQVPSRFMRDFEKAENSAMDV